MGELLIIRQCCNEDCKDSVFGRFECYFSLERKVTKRSRLNRLHRLGLSKEAVLPLRMADTDTCIL